MTSTIRLCIGQFIIGLFLSALLVFNPARAEDAPVYLVVNQAKIIAESKAGKDLNEKAKKLNESIQAELTTESNAIRKEEEEIKAMQEMFTPEVREQRIDRWKKRVQDFQISTQRLQAELEQTIIKSRREELVAAVEPIYQDIIKERKATIMVDRSTLIYASPDIDVTSEVIKRLDDKIKTVKFERVKFDQPQPEQ